MMFDSFTQRSEYEAELAEAVHSAVVLTTRRQLLEREFWAVARHACGGSAIPKEEGNAELEALRANVRMLKKLEQRAKREIRALRTLCAAY